MSEGKAFESAVDISDDTTDPVYRDARREALIIVLLWALCCAWSVTYCYFNGYVDFPWWHQTHEMSALEAYRQQRTVEDLSTPGKLGIPDWVMFGVFVPWLIISVVTVLFCIWMIKDDPEAPWDSDEIESDESLES